MTWLLSDSKPSGYWQEKQNVISEGQKYTSRSDFRWGNYSAYRSALDNGWIDEMTWFERPINYNFKWSKESVFEEAHKYTTRGAFKKGAPAAYKVAREKGWLPNMIWLSSNRKKTNNDSHSK